MEEKSLIKLAESLDLSRLEDECIILEDEKADDIYGGKFVCWGNYNNCSFGNCSQISQSKLGYRSRPATSINLFHELI